MATLGQAARRSPAGHEAVSITGARRCLAVCAIYSVRERGASRSVRAALMSPARSLVRQGLSMRDSLQRAFSLYAADIIWMNENRRRTRTPAAARAQQRRARLLLTAVRPLVG